MLKSIQRAMKEPLGIIGTLWPMVLLFPFLPGLPRPSLGGLPWRQEMALALLFTVTTAFAIKRASRKPDKPGSGLDSRSNALVLTISLFTVWTSASILWAANPYSAAHHAFQWSAYLVFFILIRLVAADPRMLRSSFYTLGAVVWIMSLACLAEGLLGAALNPDPFRLNATPLLRGFSGFGEVMAVAAPIFAALALDVRKPRRAALCGATALLAWLATLQGLERAPILGAAAALLLLTISATGLRCSRQRSLRRVGFLLAAFALATAIQVAPRSMLLGIGAGDATALERFQTTSLSDPNTNVRFLFWGVGLEMFRAHPLLGVGANNYEVAFPWARARFSAAHVDSPLVEMNEQYLAQYAHNEYVQILAELGAIGLLLFLAFCLTLAFALWQALRRAKRPLLALGSGAGLVAFALSSGASAFSFRWLGSGLVFFFAAALVSHFSKSGPQRMEAVVSHSSAPPRMALAFGLVFAGVMFVAAGAQATNSVMHAWAQSTRSPAAAERFYRRALFWNPLDASTHYDYGLFLYRHKRPEEALSHLRYAVERGLNTSLNYGHLAAVEEAAGDFAGAEKTLAQAVRTYPRSVFLLVRHAAALERQGKIDAAELALSAALRVDSRAARGWYQLINCDIDAAIVAARHDADIATPRELLPEQAVFVVLEENERRLNISPATGWRGLMNSLSN